MAREEREPEEQEQEERVEEGGERSTEEQQEEDKGQKRVKKLGEGMASAPPVQSVHADYSQQQGMVMQQSQTFIIGFHTRCQNLSAQQSVRALAVPLSSILQRTSRLI